MSHMCINSDRNSRMQLRRPRSSISKPRPTRPRAMSSLQIQGEERVQVADFVADIQVKEKALPGVFAVYDDRHAVQYVGYAKNVHSRVQELQGRVAEDSFMHLRVKLFANASMATEENMAREALHWVEEEGGVTPPGNGADAALWSPQVHASAQDTGRHSHSSPSSPFSQATVHRQVGDVPIEHAQELSVESVEQVLDSVRNYLLADGGDVAVVSADPNSGVVQLRFQGACSTCASQETTMSMGIERALRAAFGRKLTEVIAVESAGSADNVPPGTDKAAVESLLQLLRPAVTTYGGSVEVLSVKEGVCCLAYEGPDPIFNGIRSAIRDKFVDLKDVQRSGEAAAVE